jgi:sec-independent protein translocase protein TatA
MAWDDPIVWVLIIAVVVFLFGASRIPQFAKSLGQARREFEKGSKGDDTQSPGVVSAQPVVAPSAAPYSGQSGQSVSQPLAANDPLVVAAQREGIDTQGKTREQIASELSWKLNKK